MKDSFSTLFYIRGSRVDKNGMTLIYLRITVNGKRSEISLQRKVRPERWDSKKGRVRGTIPSTQELNQFLDGIVSRVYQIQGEFISDGIPYTSDMILNAFQGKGNRHNTLLSIYAGHNEELSELVGREFSSGAYQRHLRTARHLKAFIKKEYGTWYSLGTPSFWL